MMSLQVKEIIINGKREKVLVEDSIPIYYPNLFVTFELSSRALNTQKKYLESIVLLENFLVHESIDLISRVEQRPKSSYLTDSELSRFVIDAGFQKTTLEKKYAGIRILPSAFEYVGRIHAQQRIEHVRDYLNFLYEKLGDQSSHESACDDLMRRINRKVKAAKPSWKKHKLEDMKGLNQKKRDRLLEVMHPKSLENPFASTALKLRNYIVLLLGLDLGLRRSEMLLVKINDIHWHNKKISIVNLERQEIDNRPKAPQFKTHEREWVMSDDLEWALKEYVENHRIAQGNLSEARIHPFLLVSHRRNEGQALSMNALDGVLNRLRAAFPELNGVHLHSLRHDAVYTLLESMKEELAFLSPEDRTTQVQKVLTYAFGWSPESNMPGLYGAKFWKEEADKAMKRRGDKFRAIREGVEAKIRQGEEE